MTIFERRRRRTAAAAGLQRLKFTVLRQSRLKNRSAAAIDAC
jgi:hypothetical protein